MLAIHADAGDAAAQKKVAADIHDNFGGLDAVFINAGVGDLPPPDPVGRGRLRPLDGGQFEGSVLPDPSSIADPGEPGVNCAEHLDQRPHRHAEFERLRGDESGITFARSHTFWRADAKLAGMLEHPPIRGESGSHRGGKI